MRWGRRWEHTAQEHTDGQLVGGFGRRVVLSRATYVSRSVSDRIPRGYARCMQRILHRPATWVAVALLVAVAVIVVIALSSGGGGGGGGGY
jgi:hypothetical protein